MTDTDDGIPTDGEHRSVPLHAGQSEARLAVVKADIDAVHRLCHIEALYAFAVSPANAPEARLYARAKAIALLDDAVERRAPRSRSTPLSREIINASTAGCDSLTWQSPWHYGSMLDPRTPPNWAGRVLREAPLPPRQYNRIPISN